MKLADIFCFFYVFFAEMINTTILITKQYKSEKERIMFTSIVILDAMYLIAWILLTNDRSYKRFPKEQKRNPNALEENLNGIMTG